MNFEDRNPDLVYRCGLIPYYMEDDGTIKMLFMIPSNQEYGGNLYQIAKGKVEPDDQSWEDCAIREAREETGFFQGNSLLIEEVGMFMGRTTIFVAKVKNKDLFGLPSDETQTTKFHTIEEFMAEGRDLHKPVVSACYRHILKMEERMVE